MKKNKLFIALTLFYFLIANAQNQSLNEMVGLDRYSKENLVLINNKNKINVVFIGNSITAGWVDKDSLFFKKNKYIGRGISGQTSPQLLMRFRQDVIELAPKVVIINIGTNDIAENFGKYNPKFTLDNIKSMAELAKQNGIKVILSSVLPVGEYPWRKEIKNAPKLIDELNIKIKEFAKRNNFHYIDYNSAMRDSKGAMLEKLAYDGVHPTIEGYKLMEKLAKNEIDKIIK